MNQTRICYFVARSFMGWNMLLQGGVKLPQLQEWGSKTAASYEGSILHPQLVIITVLLIPCVASVVGVCLLVGLFTRFAIVLGWFMIFILMLGSSLLEDWSNLTIHNLAALYLVGLFLFVKRNYYSLDTLS